MRQPHPLCGLSLYVAVDDGGADIVLGADFLKKYQVNVLLYCYNKITKVFN